MELYYRIKFRLSYSIKTFFTKRKKTHYQCWICGKIEAPYFKEGELCAPITDGYRWHRIDKNRWICHHCDAHGFSDSDTTIPREQREPTWDEWQKYVKESNQKVLARLKKKIIIIIMRTS